MIRSRSADGLKSTLAPDAGEQRLGQLRLELGLAVARIDRHDGAIVDDAVEDTVDRPDIDAQQPAADSGDVELSDHGRLAIVDREQGAVAGQCDEAGGFGRDGSRHGEESGHGHAGEKAVRSHVVISLRRVRDERLIRSSGRATRIVPATDAGTSPTHSAVMGRVPAAEDAPATGRVGEGIGGRNLWIARHPGLPRVAAAGSTMAADPESPTPCPTPTSSTCASAPHSHCCRALSGWSRWPRPARPLRMPAVAVTDDANLFGAMQFCAAAKKAGVQPIVGALLAMAPLEALPRTPGRQPPGRAAGALGQGCRGLRKPVAPDEPRLCRRGDGWRDPGRARRSGRPPRGPDLPDRRTRRAGRRCAAAR